MENVPYCASLETTTSIEVLTLLIDIHSLVSTLLMFAGAMISAYSESTKLNELPGLADLTLNSSEVIFNALGFSHSPGLWSGSFGVPCRVIVPSILYFNARSDNFYSSSIADIYFTHEVISPTTESSMPYQLTCTHIAWHSRCDLESCAS